MEIADARVLGSEGDIVIDDPGASARHASLRPVADGSLEVEDLGSEHGTFVNQERITTVTRLYGGEEVRVGETTLLVEPDSTSETRIFTSPVARAGGAAASASASPEPPAPPAAPPVAPRPAPAASRAVGSGPPRHAFAPPSTRRRGWAENRKALPTLIVTALVLGDAAGLAIYFATR